MEHLDDVGLLESRFGPFGDGVSVRARYVHGLCQTYHRLINRFGRFQWYYMVTRLMWKLDLVRLERVLTMTQDRCSVCAERTIGSEIISDAPNGTPR
jgi:hypothetical protein